jgi:hypothetical protein
MRIGRIEPTVLTALHTLDKLESERTGLLVITAALMSQPRVVSVQASKTEGGWLVTVRRPEVDAEGHVQEHVSAAKESLSWALDRALTWLREPSESSPVVEG